MQVMPLDDDLKAVVNAADRQASAGVEQSGHGWRGLGRLAACANKRKQVTLLAEAEGFEPPVVLPTLAFKASAFGRSATLP